MSIFFHGETVYEYKINIGYSHILPFLLLENAVKYTVGEHNVDVTFEEHSKSLHVTIKSFGPFCAEEELSKITSKNYRGINSERYTSEGNGIGLYLVQHICDECNVDMRISSDFVRNINGMPCGYFSVNLIF